jgi:hypothetical protein
MAVSPCFDMAILPNGGLPVVVTSIISIVVPSVVTCNIFRIKIVFKNKDDKPVEVVHQLKLGNDSVMLAFYQIINLFDIFF